MAVLEQRQRLIPSAGQITIKNGSENEKKTTRLDNLTGKKLELALKFQNVQNKKAEKVYF